MKLHIKLGTHSASFINIPLKIPPIVGQRLEFKNEERMIRVRCHLIKDLGNNDLLYYMELF